MTAEEIEQSLFEHAIRTKIRPPFAERMSMLWHGRTISTTVVMVAAIAGTMAMTNRFTTGSDMADGFRHPQITDTDQYKRPLLRNPAPMATPDTSTVLAMSR